MASSPVSKCALNTTQKLHASASCPLLGAHTDLTLPNCKQLGLQLPASLKPLLGLQTLPHCPQHGCILTAALPLLMCAASLQKEENPYGTMNQGDDNSPHPPLMVKVAKVH